MKKRQVLQTQIYLNATKHFLKPLVTHPDQKGEVREHSRWEEMWGTLLHEMCHAYLRLVTREGLRDWMWSEGPDKGHGSHFRRCLKAVNARSGKVLGIWGIGIEKEEVGYCGEKRESCADEVDNDDQCDDGEWGEEEYYEEEFDEEEWTEEEGKTSIEDESVFDSNPTVDKSTDGEMSDPGTRQVESSKAEVKPQQEEIKAEQEEAKIEVMKAVPRPKAPPAPITWANWGGRLLENVELRHVSKGVPTGKQVGEVGKMVEVEMKKEVEKKQVEVEEMKKEVKGKKAEVVTWTWANWNGKLLEN